MSLDSNQRESNVLLTCILYTELYIMFMFDTKHIRKERQLLI